MRTVVLHEIFKSSKYPGELASRKGHVRPGAQHSAESAAVMQSQRLRVLAANAALRSHCCGALCCTRGKGFEWSLLRTRHQLSVSQWAPASQADRMLGGLLHLSGV